MVGNVEVFTDQDEHLGVVYWAGHVLVSEQVLKDREKAVNKGLQRLSFFINGELVNLENTLDCSEPRDLVPFIARVDSLCDLLETVLVPLLAFCCLNVVADVVYHILNTRDNHFVNIRVVINASILVIRLLN